MTEKENNQTLFAQAIFTVNKHAKTAPNPAFLYKLKKASLTKLIDNGLAKKEGLHFSKNPRNSKQQSDVIVSVGDYYFHMPPMKEDLIHLPHLGFVDDHYRNPKTKMSLSHAKKVLCNYTGLKEENQTRTSSISTLGTPLHTNNHSSFYMKRK